MGPENAHFPSPSLNPRFEWISATRYLFARAKITFHTKYPPLLIIDIFSRTNRRSYVRKAKVCVSVIRGENCNSTKKKNDQRARPRPDFCTRERTGSIIKATNYCTHKR